jgi:hypothetical protein
MSAYALPGFFPPLDSVFSSRNVGSASATSSSCFFGNDDSSLGKEEKVDSCNASNDQSTPLGPEQNVGISVKEAKIDAARLVHALTTRGTAATRQQQQVTASAATPVSPDHCQANSHTRSRRRNHPQHTSVTPQEDAMQFELSISFNGRKYTAMRTLPSLLQLRRDLMEEVENRQRIFQSASFEPPQHPARLYLDCGDNDKKCQDQDVCIPELPRLAEDCPWTAQASRGFSMLQGVLSSYAPTLEGWLRNMTKLVPPHDSPSWANFLWEPVSVPSDAGSNGATTFDGCNEATHFARTSSNSNLASKKSKGRNNSAMKRRYSSMPCLGKIEESDTEHDHCEDC